MIFLIISNEPWGDMWFIKHRYALALADAGFDVFFLNAPQRWTIKHLFSGRLKMEAINDRLKVVSYNNNFPTRALPNLFRKINDYVNSHKLKRITGNKESIVWQFDHFRFVDMPFLKVKKRIYHVADPYYKAPNNHFIAQKADLIICTSRRYLPYYKEYEAIKTYLPHAISDDEFIIDQDLVKELKSRFGKYLLLVASIQQNTDLELIRSLIDRGILLVIIGPVKLRDFALWNEIEKCSMYIGVVKGSLLKNYIAASNGCLVTYKHEKEIGKQGSPLKILSYLAQKKPVVSSIDPDLDDYQSMGVHFTQEHDEFISTSKRIFNGELKNDAAINQRIDEYLKQNTYSNAIKTVLKKLDL